MILNLSLSELCYLDDGLTLYKELEDKEAKIVGRVLAPMAISVASEDLLLKIGYALVHIHESGLKSFDIEFTELELWTLREVSQSSMKYNGEAVGFEIKMKVYRALMDLRTKELLKGTGLSDGVVSDPLGDTTDLLDAYSVLEDDAESSSSG
tara:strand:- start:305 stop:760 length:456 start_codon:yes stop_codon:yes gene_type:complete